METISAEWTRNRRRVLAWFKDDVFRRLLMNAGKLLSANTISAGIGFAVTALTARALGPESYGVLALVLVYEKTFGKLVSFKAWEAIIKFGSDRLEEHDQAALRQLIKFGFCLDVSSAILGTLLAIALSGPVIDLLGWSQSIRALLVLYSVLILFTLNGTPVGILRLFDRFDLLSYGSVLSAGARLVGVGWCLLTGQGLQGFVSAYLMTGVVGHLYQVSASLWVSRKQEVGNFVAQPLQGLRSTFPGIWDFVWTTNLNSVIRLLSREADELIIAALTTPAALGLFRIAKQFSRILPMLLDPLSQSVYPELARLWAKGDKEHFLSLIKRTVLMTSTAAILAWLTFLVSGRWIIAHTFGPSFLGAYLTTVVYMLALVLFGCSLPVLPAMLSLGLVRQSFFSVLIATCIYLVLLFIAVPVFGIAGASLAYVGFCALSQGFKSLLLLSHLRKERTGHNYA